MPILTSAGGSGRAFLAAASLTGGATRQALDLLSGEIHASVQSVMLDDSLFDLVFPSATERELIRHEPIPLNL